MVKNLCNWNYFCNLIKIFYCRSAMLNLFMGKKSHCDRGGHIIVKIEKISWSQNLVFHWSLKNSFGWKLFKGATHNIKWRLFLGCWKERPRSWSIKIIFKVTEVKKVFESLVLSWITIRKTECLEWNYS